MCGFADGLQVMAQGHCGAACSLFSQSQLPCLESLMRVLIHFNACEWETINMFVLTMNTLCVYVMGTAVCAEACVIRNTQKKTEIKRPAC